MGFNKSILILFSFGIKLENKLHSGKFKHSHEMMYKYRSIITFNYFTITLNRMNIKFKFFF